MQLLHVTAVHPGSVSPLSLAPREATRSPTLPDPNSQAEHSVRLPSGGDVLQRRQRRPDVRPLQQLLLQPQAVVRLPVGVRAAAQQRNRRGAQRGFCGERRRRA